MFSSEFISEFDRQPTWRALRHTLGAAATEVPEDLAAVVVTIQQLATPLYEACAAGRPFAGRWDPVRERWEPAPTE